MVNLKEAFEKCDDVKITHSDLDAFNFLNGCKMHGKDIISAAEHDQIYLSVDLESLAENATESDIEFLVSCGVCYDQYEDSLFMFV